MMKHFLTLLIIAVLLTACGGAAEPTEAPAEYYEEVDYIPAPDYEQIKNSWSYYSTYCPNTWVSSDSLEFEGFYLDESLVLEVKEGQTVIQTWKLVLTSIQINDREVDTRTWSVVQIITNPGESAKKVQELEPEKYVIKAKELAKKAPDLTLIKTFTWIRNAETGEYEWETTGECSK